MTTVEAIGEVTELVIEVDGLAYYLIANVDAPEPETSFKVLGLIAEVEELGAESTLEI